MIDKSNMKADGLHNEIGLKIKSAAKAALGPWTTPNHNQGALTAKTALKVAVGPWITPNH